MTGIVILRYAIALQVYKDVDLKHDPEGPRVSPHESGVDWIKRRYALTYAWRR